MTREDKVMASVQKAQAEGYEFLASGTGSQNESLESFRAQGYDVRGWYTSYKKDSMAWIMYGKKKGQRRAKKSEMNLVPMPGIEKLAELKTPDYASMTVKELRKICSEKKISGYSKMNKDQIVHVLAAC